MKKLLVVLAIAVSGIVMGQVYELEFKLKHIFENDTNRFIYEKYDSTLLELKTNELEDLNQPDMTFGEWINNYAGHTNFKNKYGFDKYKITYWEARHEFASYETIFIEDKQTSMIISELTLIHSYLHDKIELVSIDLYMY